MRTMDIMRNIDREQYKMDFCSLSGLPGILDDEIKSLGGKTHLLPLGKKFGREFKRMIRLEKYDVVQSHIHYPSGYILRLAKNAGVPVRITHFRITDDGSSGGLLRNLRNKILKHWINKYSTHIIAVCRGAMEEAWGNTWYSDPRCQIIYNGINIPSNRLSESGINIRQEFGFPINCNLYIHVGNLHQAKNHHRLLSIFSKICCQDEQARLLLVGRNDDAFAKDIQNQVVQLGINEKVKFAGVRDDVPRLLRAADMMIFPSHREGLPGAVLEASAAGLPVLGSDIPGICEIAHYLPSVIPLSLSMPDSDWVEKSQAMLHILQSSAQRMKIIKDFGDSPFLINNSVKQFGSIWSNVK